MKDKGRVTVFLCLMVSALVLLGTTAVKAVSIYCAKAKAAMACRTVMSDVRANYDSYIFEHYHILLFDKENYGNGEASIEERMSSMLQENLGDAYEISDVRLSGFTMIYDDDCAALKSQIKEQMSYMAVSGTVDAIKEKLGGETGSLGDELSSELEEVESEAAEADTAEAATAAADEAEAAAAAGEAEAAAAAGEAEAADESDETAGGKSKISDPRDYTSATSKKGKLLALLLPAGEDVSAEEKVPDDVPSYGTSWAADILNINTKFDDYDDLKEDVKKGSSWGDSLTEKGEALIYASNVFNCFTKKDVNSEAVLDCEIEYLIAGQASDYANLEKVCKKLIAIRLPVDMSYIITDAEKNASVRTLSVPVAAITPFLTEPVLRYLILAAWSYVEAIAEVRNLLAGNKLDFIKTKENWITDIYDISGSVETNKTSEGGLSYEEYLLLLLAMTGDKMYCRMLDVMDINARQESPAFRMTNAAVSFGADFDISFGGVSVSLHRTISYGE